MQTLIEQVVDGVRRDECKAQAALFRLLARVLEYEVDQTLLDSLRRELRDPLAEAGAEVPEDVLTADIDTTIEKLAVEYTALFVQPGAISPYASVFESGSMFQEQCDRAANWYRENGFVFKHRFSGEFPDHAGTMLAFVGALFEREAQALEQDDPEAAEKIRETRERFLIEEMGGWVPAWCKTAVAAAQHPFYERMLDLTSRVMWDELRQIVPPRRFQELVNKNARGPTVKKKSPDFRKASGL
jgi:TorA maturation chaperone TorD